MARGNSRKPLWRSRLACPSSSRTTPGRDALNDVPGRDDRPGGTQSKPSWFDVHRMRYGLRYRELPGNKALFGMFHRRWIVKQCSVRVASLKLCRLRGTLRTFVGIYPIVERAGVSMGAWAVNPTWVEMERQKNRYFRLDRFSS